MVKITKSKNTNMANKIINIGLPCTPSKRTSSKTIEGFRVFITYGGGMGGGNKTYYATKLNSVGWCWKLTLIDGYVIEVNPKFVVECEDCKIVINEYSFDNIPYYKDCNGITQYYFLHLNEDAKNLDIRGNDIKLSDRLVLTETKKV